MKKTMKGDEWAMNFQPEGKIFFVYGFRGS